MAKRKTPKYKRKYIRKMRKGTKLFCRLLREAVVDERKASKVDYPKLLRASKKKLAWHAQPPARFSGDIQGIIKDESRHHGIIDGYYRYVCGKQH